jgi:hypothetical protein
MRGGSALQFKGNWRTSKRRDLPIRTEVFFWPARLDVAPDSAGRVSGRRSGSFFLSNI